MKIIHDAVFPSITAMDSNRMEKQSLRTACWLNHSSAEWSSQLSARAEPTLPVRPVGDLSLFSSKPRKSVRKAKKGKSHKAKKAKSSKHAKTAKTKNPSGRRRRRLERNTPPI